MKLRSVVCASTLACVIGSSAGCGGDPGSDSAQVPAQETLGETQSELTARPRLTIAQANSGLEARRIRIASAWTQKVKDSGIGAFTSDPKETVRRVAAGLLSRERSEITPRAPDNFVALVDGWSKNIRRYTSEGSPGIIETVTKTDGDYDMAEKELTALLYLFKDRPALLSNEAAYNIVARGMYFWWGSATSHAMRFSIGPSLPGGFTNDWSETENHVLMTLSSQYLTNQWIYKNYRNDARWRDLAAINRIVPGIPGPRGTTTPRVTSLEYFKSNASLESTLLSVIGRIPHAGFFETNARPYQALSLHSLLNLYAFAESPKIKAAAKNALDYAAAKFAFQSIDCKRMSPHRREHENTERASLYENDPTLFMWGAVSGACAWPDTWTPRQGAAANNLDTDFYTFGGQALGHALWTLLIADEKILGAGRYRIPEPIHDFMLDKHNGFWARFQDRFTENHYRKDYNPRYFYDNGKDAYLSGVFEAAPEFNFITNEFMNVAGGNHNEYPLKGGDGGGQHIYDFWARPSSVIPAGHYKVGGVHTGDWGLQADARSKMNLDIMNMSSGGDEWWYGHNLGTYKSFNFGTDPSFTPQDPRHPLYAENGKVDWVSGAVTFRFQKVMVAADNWYYLVLGRLPQRNGQNRYFWEVVSGAAFPDVKSVKERVLAYNPLITDGINYFDQPRAPYITYKMTIGDTVTVDDSVSDYPIHEVIDARGVRLPLARFWYDGNAPASNPLMEVFEVDKNFQFTGTRYAETPKPGVIQIWNPFLKKFLLIDSSDPQNPRQEQRTTPIVSARADITGELKPSDGSWGSWFGPSYCPPGQYVTSFKMRSEAGQGSGDDTALNAVSLGCRAPNGASSSSISPHDGYWGSWTGSAECANSNPTALNNYVIGGRIRVEAPQGSGDDTGANDVQLLCSSGSSINPGGAHTYGDWGPWTSCPSDSAVCGLSVRVEGPQGSDDDTAMNGMRLICCSLPASTCKSPINEAWSDTLGSEGSGWSGTFGDPAVDTANHRLRLSYDDVVEGRARFAGSFYISHQLTLSGGTVFTPYPYTDGVLLPSIRRNANDMQLGGDRYAAAWSDLEPAGFAGKRLAGVLMAKVTTYVKGQAKQLATKVEANGAVYRSGWTAQFTNSITDLTRFRFVGENNGAVYNGPDDYVYVGALSGCSSMTDAEVDALYNK